MSPCYLPQIPYQVTEGNATLKFTCSMASLPVSQSSVTLFHLGNRPIVSQPESGLRNPAMDGMVSQRGREDMDNGAS